MFAPAEKIGGVIRHPGLSERGKCFCRYAAVAMTALLLAYYCSNQELYAGERNIALLSSKKTYVTAGISMLLIALLLLPNRLSDAKNRALTWIWFAAAPFAVYFSLYYMNAEKFSIHFFELNKIALVFTFVFLYLVQTLLFVLTGSVRVSVVIYAVAVAILGIANCFVISFRGQALSAADLFSVQTAMAVAGEYTYKLDWYMYMEILCTFTICVISMKLRGGRVIRPAARIAVLVLAGLLSSGYFYICCKTDYLENHDIRSQGFTHQLRYKQFDMLFTTLTTCFYLVADKPEGYSVERVEEIAAPYVNAAAEAGDGTDSKAAKAEKAAGRKTAFFPEDLFSLKAHAAEEEDSAQTPNIIVLMNESFADYRTIGNGITLTQDAMPFIRGLRENTIKGTAYSSVFGGNTPNSEYEFLTGNTMAFLPASSVGFNLFVRGEMPSLVSLLKDQGYEELAMHPYRGENYRRHIVYPQLGFDEYYTREDFYNPEYIRSYISDQSLANRIITEYETRASDGEPYFSYSVSMQNHGGYYGANVKNLDLSIHVIEPGVDKTKVEIYANLIRESDRVFRGLVEYFSEKEEPVVLVMFGDHQANLGDNTYERLLGGSEETLTPEELMEKYEVPFIVWANYDIEEEVVEKTSLNYLYSIIADRLDLPMSGYHRFLLDLQKQIPVINALGYWGADGVFYELDDEESPYYEALNEYQILEYNYIFGKENRYLPLFEAS